MNKDLKKTINHIIEDKLIVIGIIIVWLISAIVLRKTLTSAGLILGFGGPIIYTSMLIIYGIWKYKQYKNGKIKELINQNIGEK